MLSLEDFKAWLTEQDGKVFVPGDVCNCPVAQYASARMGEPCWASYDQIFKVDLSLDETNVALQDPWVLGVISVVDAQPSPLSAKEVLALLK